MRVRNTRKLFGILHEAVDMYTSAEPSPATRRSSSASMPNSSTEDYMLVFHNAENMSIVHSLVRILDEEVWLRDISHDKTRLDY